MDKYIFADEAGCFTFNRNPNVSKYFIICTITMTDLSVGVALADLRRKLVWEGLPLRDYFHATTDAQAVRDRVFQEFAVHQFKVQAVICEKAKAQPSVTKSKHRFYKYPWYYSLKHGISPHISPGDKVLATVASIGTAKEQLTYRAELDDVFRQTASKAAWAVDFVPSRCNPWLQVADYCAWAIQRKWETGDVRSYDLIKDRITNEYDLWAHGAKFYY